MQNVMHEHPRGASQDIDGLLGKLTANDGLERRRARQALVDMGSVAVPALIAELRVPQDHARWEAAKALCEIHAPDAAPALVERLEDDNFSVRWLAAEALVGLGDAALVPLLQALVRRADSVWLRRGAHHILRALSAGRADGVLKPVLHALDDVEPQLQTPIAAEHALWDLTTGHQ